MYGSSTFFSSDPASGFTPAIVSKTTTYATTTADDVIYVDDSGGSWTLSFPSAASSSGHIWKIIKTNSSTNQVTLDPNGSETLNGYATMKVFTQYEEYEVQSNGTNLFVLGHRAATPWVTDAGFAPNAAGFGTVSNKSIRWRRVGDTMEVQGSFTVGTTVVSQQAFMALPTGYSIDVSKMTAALKNDWGIWSRLTNATTHVNAVDQQGPIMSDGSVTDRVWFVLDSSSNVYVKDNVQAIFSDNTTVTMHFWLPILNWYE